MASPTISSAGPWTPCAAAGRPASFVLWPLREPAELAYWFGQRPAGRVVRGGRMVEGGA